MAARMNRRADRRNASGRSVRGLLVAVALAGGWSQAPAQPAATDATILIYDASGSMWGQLAGGATKLQVARDVIGGFFASRDQAGPLGVIAYGHNRRGDCNDIEVLAPVAVHDPRALADRLNSIRPVGMTPLTAALQRAADEIPATAESADIILVTDGLETCHADPCALAAQLAGQGIQIRAHVVGFGLTDTEAAAMACITEATGGLLLTPRNGQELADALQRIEQAEPAPAPTPAVPEQFFDIGPHAEAGHTYVIGYKGTAGTGYYAGFTPRGEGSPGVSASFGVLSGDGPEAPNRMSRAAPAEPGDYDLVMIEPGGSIVARQPIKVVPPSNGFDAVGTVEPGTRFAVTWRGPDQVGQRVVIARQGDAPGTYLDSWGYVLHKKGTMTLRAPADIGVHELRYLSADQKDILFSRKFGVGVPFEDADTTDTRTLAARAAAATQAVPGQDALPLITARFRTPAGAPQSPLSWTVVALDSDTRSEPWAPATGTVVAEGRFEPGRYEVKAVAPGEVVFRDVVEIVPGQGNDFEIPLDTPAQPPGDDDGFAEPVAAACAGQAVGCRFVDADTGLALMLPDGWSITQPFRYRTAAGHEADIASATVFRAGDGGVAVIELNPRHWPAVRGNCVDAGVHRLCHGEGDSDELRAAMQTLTRSLGEGVAE